RVLATLNANSIFNVCNPDLVPRVVFELDKPTHLNGAGYDLGLTVGAFAVPRKVALFLEKGDAGSNFGSRDGDTIGLKITDAKTSKAFFYIPGCAEIDAPLADRIRGAELIFLDGTLFTDNEMVSQGLSTKTGKRMGHIAVSGPNGSVETLRPLNVNRRICVHINNSNPILDENSEARKFVEAAGWEVGFDGMEVRVGPRSFSRKKMPSFGETSRQCRRPISKPRSAQWGRSAITIFIPSLTLCTDASLTH